MKKTSKKRLTLDRETVKALVVELSTGQLRYVEGGVPVGGTITGSSQPDCGCPSGVTNPSGRRC